VRPLRLVSIAAAVCLSFGSCRREPDVRHFATPEEAVQAFIGTVKAGQIDELLAYFGPEGNELVDSSDPATGRRNQEVFVAAVAEQWRLEDRGPDAKELIVGNEDWPFPIPLVRDEDGWRFDAAAGLDEVLTRRIGRNELAAIDTSRAYVAAQRAYARTGHDGRRTGRYATRFNSEPGTQNGLYWPVKKGEPRSPLGELVAAAAGEGEDLGARRKPAPFHGYYFRILTAQGPNAAGGAIDYMKDGDMTAGFALIAWPADYGTTGIMTFLVGPDGTVLEKDLGADTAATVPGIVRFDPDSTWTKAAAN
jgi:hypothetical protein